MNDNEPTPGAPDPADLVTLKVVDSEFEANTIVAALRETGIEAVAFGTVNTLWPMTGVTRVPVQVRRDDLDRARAALKKTIADSVDLDWDEVDVGEREDQVPLTPVGRMPLLPRMGQIAAIIVTILIILLVARFLGVFPRW